MPKKDELSNALPVEDFLLEKIKDKIKTRKFWVTALILFFSLWIAFQMFIAITKNGMEKTFTIEFVPVLFVGVLMSALLFFPLLISLYQIFFIVPPVVPALLFMPSIILLAANLLKKRTGIYWLFFLYILLIIAVVGLFILTTFNCINFNEGFLAPTLICEY